MAALTAAQANVLASDTGPGPRWAVIDFQRVTAGDTFDASTLTAIPAFSTVTAALFYATSNRTETTALCTLAGTTATVVGTGIANDSGLLFLVGE
jgi:hypothetical protein